MHAGMVRGTISNKATEYSPLGDVVLIGIDCPNDELLCWTEELAGLATVRSASSFDDVLPPKDTLVVTIWSGGIMAKGDNSSFPNLLGILQPSTRVVGIYIDPDKLRALAPGAAHYFPELSWLRRVSDMVVISSDGGVVAELVSTLALAAL